MEKKKCVWILREVSQRSVYPRRWENPPWLPGCPGRWRWHKLRPPDRSRCLEDRRQQERHIKVNSIRLPRRRGRPIPLCPMRLMWTGVMSLPPRDLRLRTTMLMSPPPLSTAFTTCFRSLLVRSTSLIFSSQSFTLVGNTARRVLRLLITLHCHQCWLVVYYQVIHS